MLLWVITLGSVCLTYAYFRLKSKRSKSPFPGLPCPPNPHWLIGHVENRKIDIEDSLRELVVDHANASGVTAMWYLGTPTATVLRHQDARSILQSTPNRMSMPKLIRKHLDMLTGPRNILVLEGREWKYHRSAIVRALGSRTMDKAKRTSVQVSSQLAKTLLGKSSGEVELRPLMQMLTLDIFGKSALNVDFDNCKNLEFHPLAKAFHFMSQEYDLRMENPLVGFFYGLPTKRNREYMDCRHRLRSFIEELVKQRLASGIPQDGEERDFLDHLLQSSEELKETKELSSEIVESTLTDILMTLLFAGHETSSLALLYAIMSLAQNAEVEKKCLDEIDAVWKDEDEIPDPKDLAYCSAVITEALRMYPPVPGMVRTLTKPVKVGHFAEEYELPVGTYTYMPFIMIHRDERNFPRPMEFLPERWVAQDKDGTWHERDSEAANKNDDSGVPAGNKDAFFAFSTGGRSCAGQKFAMQETVLVIANLIRNIKFQWKEGYELHVMHAGTGQKPKDSVPVVFSAR